MIPSYRISRVCMYVYIYIYAQLLASDIIAIQVSHVTYMRSRDRYMVSHDRPTQSDGRGREEEEEPGGEKKKNPFVVPATVYIIYLAPITTTRI